MQADDFNKLKGNPLNPRTMSRIDANNLKASMQEFGDMSGIVFNVRTEQLVGGHMRTGTFKRLGGKKSITIITRWDEPKSTGTVAVGFIGFGDEYYAYREVDWPAEKELAANVAANRISGDWDLVKLANVNDLIKQSNEELLKLTGQSDEELQRLEQLGSGLEPEPAKTDDPRESFNVKLTEDQSIVVDQAIAEVSARIKLGRADNEDLRGNAIVEVCRNYLDSLDDSQPQS